MTANRVVVANGKFEWPEELNVATAVLRQMGHRVKFQHEALKRGEFRSFALGGQPIRSSGELYSAFLLHESDLFRFWFALDFAFASAAGRTRLTQAGIVILAGALAGEAREIVRAEWDVRDKAHAQPHWHVYGSEMLETFRAELAGFGLETATNDTRLDISRFHFAMSARWMDVGNTANKNHVQEATAVGVKQWLSACLSYSKAELEYLTEHAVRVLYRELGAD